MLVPQPASAMVKPQRSSKIFGVATFMPTSFFQYEMLPTTWFFVSALIMLAMFFKFNRFWSIRNIDLIGLILFTPGLMRSAK